MKTRFPTWWRLVGSAVEHAARQAVAVAGSAPKDVADGKGADAKPVPVTFEKLFSQQREDDEESVGLGEFLDAVAKKWPGIFGGSEIAQFINRSDLEGDDVAVATMFKEFLFEGDKLADNVSAIRVGRRLERHVGNVVQWEERRGPAHRTETWRRREGRKALQGRVHAAAQGPRARSGGVWGVGEFYSDIPWENTTIFSLFPKNHTSRALHIRLTTPPTPPTPPDMKIEFQKISSCAVDAGV